MKTKYLVCELVDNKVIGGTIYADEESAKNAFQNVIVDYGVEYGAEQGANLFRVGNSAVQIVEVLVSEQ